MTIKALLRHFTEMYKYFIAAALVFAAGVYLGFGYSEQFDALLKTQIEGLRTLAESLSEKNHSMLWFFGFIFLNNALKSILVLFAGVAFGIAPLAFLLINGMLVGYLGEMFAKTDQLGAFMIGILPHGIIEIPAIILACAYGIKFGSIMAKGVLRMVSAQGRAAFTAELERFLKICVPLIGVLTVSLLAAALIESMITPWLIGR